MNNRDIQQAEKIADVLNQVNQETGHLPGITPPDARWCLACQIVDSLRRVKYAHVIRDKPHTDGCAIPYSGCFDPLKAAVIWNRRGNIEEAWWLVFLATHFGKHSSDAWQLVEAVYGALNQGSPWTWEEINHRRQEFFSWLRSEHARLREFHFSNHRKYESLDPSKSVHTVHVIESYLNWIEKAGTHANLVRRAHERVGQRPGAAFDHLYRSMDEVRRFGRLGRFDFLTMIGKLGIAPIEPDSAYLWHNATGPIRGARLLFDGSKNGPSTPDQLDQKFLDLDKKLSVGMQVLEDSTCNWQKRPTEYQRFRG